MMLLRSIRDRGDQKSAQELVGSGFFDAGWYTRTYNLPDEVEPIGHYQSCGGREGNSPGPWFDSQWYLDNNVDVRSSGLDPLLHYLRHGRGEGRSIRTVGRSQANPGEVSFVLNMTQSENAPGRIVVVVHAYYIDVFDEVCRYLKNIEANFTLCVSVVSRDHVELVRQAVFAAGLPAQLICRVGQNRGRNFGGMLVEFSSVIAEHELVLHLHTKRSLYSGREQTEWREALYSSLVGAKPLVRGILNAFAERCDLGLVQPSTFRDLPYWAHHWLSNKSIAMGLLQRLGVSEAPETYFDFPVGGMFWARVDAIQPLLEARFSYEDFPPEQGQTDGTLAHAIERSIGILSKHRGYRFLEVDYEAGAANLDWSERNFGQYRSQTLADFDRLVSQVDLVSFDIFDTLVVRPSRSPDAIINFVNQRLASDLPRNDFFARRKRAEDAARRAKAFCGDVDIHEIYTHFGLDGGWTPDLVERAKRMEIDLERRAVRPRPSAHRLIQKARARGLRVIAISDTYLPPAEVAHLLNLCGFGGLIDYVYVSNEQQARKDRGDMWQVVREKEGVAVDRWLHVGDNEQADIQAAADRGLKYFHVMNPVTLLQLSGFETNQSGGEDTYASDLVVGPAVLKLGGDPFCATAGLRGREISAASDVGYVVFGPVLFAFVSWLVSHRAFAGLEKVFFLAREGYVLQRIYEMIRSRRPELGLPPSVYLLASRRAALAASQAVHYTPERVVSGAGFNGTFGQLMLSRLGFEINDTELSHWRIELDRDDAEVIQAVGGLQQQLLEHSQQEQEFYGRYLLEAGLRPGRPYGVVDVGYSATIQKSLQEITEAKLVGFYFGISPQAAGVERRGGSAFGCFHEAGPTLLSEAAVMKYSIVLEAFLTAPHGQFLKMTRDGAQFKANSTSGRERSIISDMQSGAERYCSDLLEVYGADLLFGRSLSKGVQETFRMLCEGDLTTTPEILRALSVEDEYCGNGVRFPLLGS